MVVGFRSVHNRNERKNGKKIENSIEIHIVIMVDGLCKMCCACAYKCFSSFIYLSTVCDFGIDEKKWWIRVWVKRESLTHVGHNKISFEFVSKIKKKSFRRFKIFFSFVLLASFSFSRALNLEKRNWCIWKRIKTRALFNHM